MFLQYDLGAKVVIIDLPEMISFSSACVNKVLPQAKICFPNDVNKETSFDEFDFIFLLPDQTDLLPSDWFDCAFNCMSMCEMDKKEIDLYFNVIQRVVKNKGYFLCSNRLRKYPSKKVAAPDVKAPLVDEVEGTNVFFQYPWRKENIDKSIDVNAFRYRWQRKKHLTIDRLQQIIKK